MAAGIIATRLAELGDRFELGVLEYDQIRAEEGFANAQAGLCHRLDDFLAGELPAPEIEWAAWYKQGRANDVDASFKSLTRITNPLLPRQYAEVGRAAAMAIGGEQWREEDIRQLTQLAHDWIASFEGPGIELERIYRCLMQGHLLAGNEDAAKVAASQMNLAKKLGKMARD